MTNTILTTLEAEARPDHDTLFGQIRTAYADIECEYDTSAKGPLLRMHVSLSCIHTVTVNRREGEIAIRTDYMPAHEHEPTARHKHLVNMIQTSTAYERIVDEDLDRTIDQISAEARQWLS